jgi:alpha-tubulin suppressor-like RCC1 family protein
MPRQDTALPAAIALVSALAACGSLAQGRDAATDGACAREDSAAADGPFALEAGVGSDATAATPADARVDVAPIPTTLVQTSPEPWGGDCPRGGVKIVTALDLNGNRTIDAEDETVGVQVVCNVYPVGVSLGSQHGCALASNGTVWCWGADDLGQLGDYGQYAAFAPRVVGGVDTALAVAVGGDFACVILPTTGVRCWGRNDRGQGGHGGDEPFISPSCVNTPSGALLGATSLALGGAHACAALEDGTVWCWGANDSGQLGDGTAADRNFPAPVPGITEARAVAAGGRHTCVLRKDATVRCWGGGDEGQLGNGTTTAQAALVTVSNPDGTAPLAGVTALAAGEAFTCALMQDETVLCWGANPDCQLGLPSTTPRALLPVAAPVYEVQSLVAGAQHACAVLSSGRAVCWGRNDFGQVGAPAGVCRAEPVPLPLAHVLALGVGRTHSCAVDEIGLWCWGDNSLGQLGIGIASASRSTSEPQPAVWPLAL